MTNFAIEETDGKLNLEFFDTKMTVDVISPDNGVRQLVRMVKLLELKVIALERQLSHRQA